MIDVIALTLYPASQDCRRWIEKEFGANAIYLDLSGLRQLSILKMVKTLRAHPCKTVVIPIERLNEEAMASVLKVVGGITASRQRLLFFRGGRRESFGRIAQVAGVLKLIVASIVGFAALRAGGVQASKLRKQPRLSLLPPIESFRGAPNIVAYLYGNFSLGIQAGGSYGHIAGVANALMDRGFDLDFMCIDDGPPVDERAVRHRIDIPRSLALPLELNFHWTNQSTIRQLMKKVSPARHVFIYQRLSLANFAGVVLSRTKHIPLIVEYNGSEVWTQMHWGNPLRFPKVATLAEEVTLKHAHLVVTISEPLRDELIQRGIDPTRIVMYPNCYDPKVFSPERFTSEENQELRARLDLTPDCYVATFVGTFGRWHGAEVMATAIRLMCETNIEEMRRAKLRFLFVGNGLTMPEVRQILASPVCAEFVRFSGLVPQREGSRYLAISDICIAPHVANADGSRFFGSPTKLFEYMAMEKGIVASDLDQIGEVLQPAISVSALPDQDSPPSQDDRVAVLVRPGSPDDLARAILFLTRFPAWAKHLGANARAKALANYTWDKHVEAILAGLTRVKDRLE